MTKKFVAYIDEVGRGALAGPVMACAVCITSPNAELQTYGERDSKQLSPKKREEIYTKVFRHPNIVWAIGSASSQVIDQKNIHQATRLAMKLAVRSLEKKLSKKGKQIHSLVIDGTSLLDSTLPQKAVPKADALFPACAIASIIAKVTRDRLMIRYHKTMPSYLFSKHKGYGTKEHVLAIAQHGICNIHRVSFHVPS
ncbi:MAG: ribonuclease HII [bacterium]|nr:ribonuclease HII [bacterium]